MWCVASSIAATRFPALDAPPETACDRSYLVTGLAWIAVGRDMLEEAL